MKRDDAGQVRLERQHLQIEHQLRVLFEAGWNTGGTIHRRQLARRLLLGALNPPLDVAHPLEILAELGAVARADGSHETSGRLGDRVEDAAVLLQSGAAHGGSVLSLSPNSRSNTARGRYSTGSGVVGVRHESVLDVGAAPALFALPDDVVAVQAELERRELGVPAELLGGDLVDGDPHATFPLRVNAREEHAAGALVRRRLAFAGARVADAVVEPAQHQQRDPGTAPAVRGSGSIGTPRHPSPASTCPCSCRSARRRRRGGRSELRLRRERGKHPVQEGQRHGGAHAHEAPRGAESLSS